MLPTLIRIPALVHDTVAAAVRTLGPIHRLGHRVRAARPGARHRATGHCVVVTIVLTNSCYVMIVLTNSCNVTIVLTNSCYVTIML